MSNYDYLGTKEKRHMYPLKIYLSKNDTVVIMYTGALYNDNFQIQNTTCVITKAMFYNAIENLKKMNSTIFTDGDLKIKIDLFEKYCDIKVYNKFAEVSVTETDTRFQKWLLSIDLRESKRVETLIPISVETADRFEYGAMLDMSKSGFKVALISGMNVGDIIKISVFDDEYPVGNIKCEIRHETIIKDKYVYGLKIIGMDEDSEYVLKKILERESRKQ